MDDFCFYEVILYFISHVCQLTDMFSFGSMLENAHIYFIYWSLKFFPYTEASAKTKDGVQCAFEELVEKILQTPGLWESENQGQKVRLGDQEHARPGACGGYCSIPWKRKSTDVRGLTSDGKRRVSERWKWMSTFLFVGSTSVGRTDTAVCTLPFPSLIYHYFLFKRIMQKKSLVFEVGVLN